MGLELSRGGSAQHCLDTSAVGQQRVARLPREHALGATCLALDLDPSRSPGGRSLRYVACVRSRRTMMGFYELDRWFMFV
jgi:hypothetical protein